MFPGEERGPVSGSETGPGGEAPLRADSGLLITSPSLSPGLQAAFLWVSLDVACVALSWYVPYQTPDHLSFLQCVPPPPRCPKQKFLSRV